MRTNDIVERIKIHRYPKTTVIVLARPARVLIERHKDEARPIERFLAVTCLHVALADGRRSLPGACDHRGAWIALNIGSGGKPQRGSFEREVIVAFTEGDAPFRSGANDRVEPSRDLAVNYDSHFVERIVIGRSRSEARQARRLR